MSKSVIQSIIPHLWFDTQALEAAEFYTSIFPESKIELKRVIRDTPSGDCDYLGFSLWGKRFEAISAGPDFSFNPSISFMVNFDPLFFRDQKFPEKAAVTKLDEIWERLSDGGKPLMEVGEYDFSSRYGWIEDRYGLSWQLILTDSEGSPRPPIMPAFLFTGDVCGRAEEAGDFYLSVFKDSERGIVAPYPAGMEYDREGTLMFSDFRLGNDWFVAMDSGWNHGFQFNEAVSFIVKCPDQTEIDYYWEKLSAVPEAEQCGWLKDQFGVSWQIVPSDMDRMMAGGNEKQLKAVTEAFLGMKKFDLAGLQEAWEAGK